MTLRVKTLGNSLKRLPFHTPFRFPGDAGMDSPYLLPERLTFFQPYHRFLLYLPPFFFFIIIGVQEAF